MVCTSAKSKVIGGGCCYDKGGEALLQEIQQEIERRGLCGSLIAKGSACMSNCKQGITVRTLPDRKIYPCVEREKINPLLDSLKKPVPKS